MKSGSTWHPAVSRTSLPCISLPHRTYQPSWQAGDPRWSGGTRRLHLPVRRQARRDGYRGPVPALVLVALSLGLSNFAAAIGIGVAGVDNRTRVRVGVVFGIFETAMPILGLALGHSLASTLGHAARWVGAGLLIATG